MSSDTAILNEVKQRTVRIETRLMTLASEMGIDLRLADQIAVDAAEHTATVQTMDVPISVLISACRKAGLFKTKVKIVYNGNTVCTVYV